jgi:hypothetical protein
MDNFNNIKHIIFEIKALNLIVYRVLPSVQTKGTLDYEVYWSDHINLQGTGPFKNIWEATNNYDYELYRRGQSKPVALIAIVKTNTLLNNLIPVNFKTRKRLVLPNNTPKV